MMSLILTQINKFGIVFVTDSNITVNGSSTEKGKKIFKISRLKAAMCLTGAYSVDGKRMDKWIIDYIGKDKSKSLKEFAKKLCKSLEGKMTSEEKSKGCIVHICGFVKEKDHEHPEMWGISNIDLLPDGKYSSGKEQFNFREDFWNRDWTKNNLKNQFVNPASYGYQYYINGFTAGRISFNILTQYLNDFLSKVWKDGNYSFRSPRDIKEYESLAKFTMDYIGLMFNLSDYSPKYIGGKVFSYCIKPRNKSWFTR